MNQMNLNRNPLKLTTIAAVSLLFAQIAGAQTYFSASQYGDLVAGFRKYPSEEPYQLVVDLGNVTNFLKLSVGTTIPITNYSNVQITNMCPDNLANLQWSVFTTVIAHGAPTEQPWVTPIGTFPKASCWYTLPRSSINTPTTPPQRFSYSLNGSLRSKILGLDNGASSISQSIGSTNQFNNTILVNEPTSYDASGNTYNILIQDATTPTIGDFGGPPGSPIPSNETIENVTPDPFNSPVRSDLYEDCSTGSGSTFTDPYTGQQTGACYYVGYFTMNTDGTMTFTRDALATNTPPPPVPQLSISATVSSIGGGSTQVNSTISFGTTNGATYTLYYTNASGLTTAISNWPTISPAIIGDGSPHVFTNSSTDPNRFYVVGAH